MDVPFVDVVTTERDTSLPLTVPEWEEWGDPLHNESDYQYMLSYSPYDNIRRYGRCETIHYALSHTHHWHAASQGFPPPPESNILHPCANVLLL